MTARDRRVLVLGGCVVLGAVLALRVVPWGVARLAAARAELRERAAFLARARAELADAPALRDSVAGVTQALVGLAPKLLNGTTAAEAAADLSGRLELATSRHQAKLERVEQLTDSARAGRFVRVRLRAAVETDIRGLAGLLRAVEFGEAALAVQELRVVAPDPNPPERAAEVLRADLTVAGWFLAARDTSDPRPETGP